nr:TetR family transcriptional regulator [Komagataeibacter xylinus]
MSEELDALILKTATRLFGEQGYAATSVEQIAAVAKVGKQTIYRRPPPRKTCSRRSLPNRETASSSPPYHRIKWYPAIRCRRCTRPCGCCLT